MAGKHAGRRGARYRRLVAAQRAKGLPCWLCGQPIDYSAPPGHPNAFEYDHAQPWSTHPELREDPANGRSSHGRCNRSRGNQPPNPGLGQTSRAW